MGRNKKLHQEDHILTAAFSAGLATGLRNGELNTGDRKYLRYIAGLSDRDVAHIAQVSKPDVKGQPQRMRDIELAQC